MNLKNISANKKNEMIKIHTSGYCYCHRRFNALGGNGDKTHQRVIMTRWWSFWGVEREREGVVGGKEDETHQRVIMTRWWSFWPA